MRLPELLTEIDCAPIGYPGLKATCWLNPPLAPDWVPHDKRTPPEKPEGAWDTEGYHSWARIVRKIEVPSELSTDGHSEVYEIKTAKDVWDFEKRPDGDPQLIYWIMGAYARERSRRLVAEAKN